jgi:hypothetical protein
LEFRSFSSAFGWAGTRCASLAGGEPPGYCSSRVPTSLAKAANRHRISDNPFPHESSSGCLSFHSGGEVDADSDHNEKRDNGSDHSRPPGRVERIAVVGEKGCHLAVLHQAEYK